ncbi:MAG: transposase [candidate division KSB1 bacterium]|nr:transposase [candidate division KSB1 bacterium]MDZ7317591.1 transposase [candidate division KSB1 bacterium]MDZ7340198.1 transposase [candidate division KSB1 bacterium]
MKRQSLFCEHDFQYHQPRQSPVYVLSRRNELALVSDVNLPVHHSKPVKKWLAEHFDEIELFFLPAYSPELNPYEYLNRDFKQSVANKPPARNENQLKTQLMSQMKSIQKFPERVRSYFKNPDVIYAK